MEHEISNVVLITWGVTLVLVAAIAFRLGKAAGVMFCRGKAKELCDAYLKEIGYAKR